MIDWGSKSQKVGVDSTPAARVIIAAKQHGLNVGLLTCALMRAVWVDEANVSEPAVLHSLLEAQALPAEDLLEWAGSDDVSDEYAANTEEAITQGVFGVQFVHKETLPLSDR
mgnify:CR=1 FL=1